MVGAETAAAVTIIELAGGWGSKALGAFMATATSSAGAGIPHTWSCLALVWNTAGGGSVEGRVGSLLTACSQGQTSGTASNEVVQGVVGFLADLGTDAGGDAKYGTNGSYGAGGKEWVLSQGPRGA